MSSRLDFYFRQKVTEAELNLGFELLEKADRDLAADLGIYGVVSGAVPAPHTPVADLTIDLTAPGRCYDNLGQRLFFGTGQTVNCAVDLVGLPTEVSAAGRERWLAVFIRFRRLLSDPRTDGNSQQVFFRQDESFEIVVRQAPEGTIGAAPRPELHPDELLLCDVRRRAGQTQIVATDIDSTRRQAFVFAQSQSVAVQPGLWRILQPATATVQAALDEVDAEFAAHFAGTARRHTAAAVDTTPHGFLTATNAQAALDQVVDSLASTTAGSAGAARVGADAVPGAPYSLPAGTVDSQLANLLSLANIHQSLVTAAHPATAISALPFEYLTATNVQTMLQQLVTALAATTAGQSGAVRVGSEAYAGTPFSAGGATVAAQIQSLLANLNALAFTYAAQHFSIGDAEQGHKTIFQPRVNTTTALLWDALGTGASGNRLRVYLDNNGLAITLNAAAALGWAKDVTSEPSIIARLKGAYVSVGFHNRPNPTFFDSDIDASILLSMGTYGNFFLSGSWRDTGYVSLTAFNGRGAQSDIYVVGSASYRNLFERAPRSISLVQRTSSGSWVQSPVVIDSNTNGFAFAGTISLAAGQTGYWCGEYVAS